MKRADEITLGLQVRAFELERGFVSKDRRVAFPASSEAPYLRRSWEMGEYVEILDHTPASIRLERLRGGAPLLKDHRTDSQIGIIEEAAVRDRRLEVAARFGSSQLAVEELRDVDEGIRRNVSLGYIVHEMVLEKRGDDGPDVYRVTDWEPLEVSTVSIPADATVGFGRAESLAEFRNHSTRVVSGPGGPGAPRKESTMPEPELKSNPQINDAMLAAATQAERDRCANIRAIGKRFGCAEEADDAIAAGTDWELFRDRVWHRQPEGKPLDRAPSYLGMGSRRGLSLREQERYGDDFVKTLRNLLEGRQHERTMVTELSEHLASERGQGLRGPLGFLVDAEALFGSPSTRDLSVGTATAGGHLVATQLLAGSFIEFLRPRSAVLQMNPTVLSGLVGNVDVPRQTGGSTAGFVSEGSNIGESQPTFDKVSLTPKTVGVRTDVTRKLMLQSTPAILGVVRKDIADGIATLLDVVTINGSGTAPTPRGVLNQSGIGSVTWTATNALTKYQSVIALLTALASANADSATSGFITTPEVRAALMSVYPDAGAGSSIWSATRDADGRSSLLGYPAVVTNNVPKNLGGGTNEHALIFGNWSEVLIGLWSVLEIQVDPYTLGDSGGTVVRAFQDLDVAVRHATSFAKTSFIP